METKYKYIILSLVFIFAACSGAKTGDKNGWVKLWLIGDSTMADYTLYPEDYKSARYPITGWGQVFQPFVSDKNLKGATNLFKADSVLVVNKAKGGRSTRTFFQEGRWREVYEALQPGDFVLIQFGHNDAAENKPERYVDIEGYKEFLRLFILQTHQKKATPILITPVARNYPWENGHLKNVHGDYPKSMKEIAAETNTGLIDLNEMSMDFFSNKGKEYVSGHYFMNLPAGKFEAYPDGQNDNTHFQPEGATEVARLVFNGLTQLANQAIPENEK
jgi:lysophospholipase L1-like esterase